MWSDTRGGEWGGLLVGGAKPNQTQPLAEAKREGGGKALAEVVQGKDKIQAGAATCAFPLHMGQGAVLCSLSGP